MFGILLHSGRYRVKKMQTFAIGTKLLIFRVLNERTGQTKCECVL